MNSFFKKNINIRSINVEINLGYGGIQTMWFNSYSWGCIGQV
jgi:hypothetical protein